MGDDLWGPTRFVFLVAVALLVLVGIIATLRGSVG